MQRALLQFGIRNFVFVTFSTISRLSRDLPIVNGGGNQSTCENHRLTPCHCQLSHMPQVGYEPGHWWETASGQWQRLRPYGHQNRPNIAVIYTLSNSVASRTLWYSVFVIYIFTYVNSTMLFCPSDTSYIFCLFILSKLRTPPSTYCPFIDTGFYHRKDFVCGTATWQHLFEPFVALSHRMMLYSNNCM